MSAHRIPSCTSDIEPDEIMASTAMDIDLDETSRLRGPYEMKLPSGENLRYMRFADRPKDFLDARQEKFRPDNDEISKLESASAKEKIDIVLTMVDADVLIAVSRQIPILTFRSPWQEVRNGEVTNIYEGDCADTKDFAGAVLEWTKGAFGSDNALWKTEIADGMAVFHLDGKKFSKAQCDAWRLLPYAMQMRHVKAWSRWTYELFDNGEGCAVHRIKSAEERVAEAFHQNAAGQATASS